MWFENQKTARKIKAAVVFLKTAAVLQKIELSNLLLHREHGDHRVDSIVCEMFTERPKGLHREQREQRLLLAASVKSL